MSEFSLDPRSSLEKIVTEVLDATFSSASAMGGGFGGAAIYRVRVRSDSRDSETDIVIKLGEVQGKVTTGDDDVDERVYGARSWSLLPVHSLLRERGIPTYDLLGQGFPTPDLPFFWIAMSVLSGEPVRGCSGDPDPEDFHRVCGEALGALHAVTRSDDGFVDQVEPDHRSWTDAFFQSLENALAQVLAHRDETFGRHEPEIRAFVETQRRNWVAPREYSLSHPDGLQGNAEYRDGRWHFTGHLDLEDYSFTDPRFPLAGYELGAAGPVPAAFWEGYRTHKEIDPSYAVARNLFKLYYLLDWFWIVYSPRWNSTPADIARSSARQTAAILRTIRGE